MHNLTELSDENLPSELRQRAEAQAQAHSVNMHRMEALSPEAARRLIYELQVYQIELEMQNEELRQTQNALEQVRSDYFDLYDLAPIGYLILSEKGLIEQANLYAINLLGQSRSRLLTQQLSQFFDAPGQDDFYHLCRQLLSTGKAQACELPLSRPDDPPCWVRADATLGQKDQSAAQTIRITLLDISERKEAEAEREALLVQVQTQEIAQEIAQVIQNVPAGVLLLDGGGRVTLTNPLAAAYLLALAGTGVGELISHLGDRSLADLLTPDADWQTVAAGSSLFEVISRPIADGTGNGRWVLVIRDVTQERETQRRVEQQARLAAVGQLAAGIAHDFNNILGVIVLQAEMVERVARLGAADSQRLQIIRTQTKHAARLIQQILDFSRSAVLERSVFDLRIFLHGEIELLSRTLPENIQIGLDCQPGEYLVLADPTRMQQMLMNLAINSRDAMPNGGELRVTLTHSAAPVGREEGFVPWIQLTMADTGEGIEPAIVPHIFEPFFTTKEPGKGSGLGLAQIYGIVKQHEGEIDVHSVRGKGTTFTIHLPGTQQPASMSESSAIETAAGSGERVLIVEDNAVLQDALGEIVEMLGYRVLMAHNGKEALELLTAEGSDIDIVLSDLTMPVMGGEELFKTMRVQGLRVPVLILSGHPLENAIEDLKAEGLAGWIVKPPTFEQLRAALAQALHPV